MGQLKERAAAPQNKRGQVAPPPCRISASHEARASILLRNNVDVGVLLGALDAKLDHTVGLREQSVIGANADVYAGAIHGPTLTDQDIAREHGLAAELLDAEALGVRIAAVTGTAACFFM